MTLDAGSSSRSVRSYQWAITAGASNASLIGSTTAATATLVTTGVGPVTVSVSVVDSVGSTATTSKTLSVVALPTAIIKVVTLAPTAGEGISIDGSASFAGTGRTIVGYQWTIASGSNVAAFASSTNSSSATLATTGAGTVVVSLEVTDSAGAARSVTQSIDIAAAPVVVEPPAAGSSGGGGGGALGWGWMLGLASAILLLARRRDA